MSDNETDAFNREFEEREEEETADGGQGQASVNLNTCDVKITANSRSYNTAVHVYEHATREKIDEVVGNAIYAFTTLQERIQTEIIDKKVK